VCKWLYNITLEFIKIPSFIENKSQVAKEEVKELCDIHGLNVIYTSSKFGIGINELINFAMLAHAVKVANM